MEREMGVWVTHQELLLGPVIALCWGGRPRVRKTSTKASIESGARLTVDGLLMAGEVNSLDTTDLLLDGVGQSRAGDGRGARGGVQSSDECAPLGSVLCQLTGGGPQGRRETSGRHGEGCSEWGWGGGGKKLEGM
jgi:hypothetical protein